MDFQQCSKVKLYGLIIWAIPFLTSFFVWDFEANAPSIPMAWFNAIMALTFAIGLVIALKLTFWKTVKKDYFKWSLNAGISWYIELLLLDLIFLVWIFKMSWADYFPMIVTYLNAPIITISVGKILSWKEMGKMSKK